MGIKIRTFEAIVYFYFFMGGYNLLAYQDKYQVERSLLLPKTTTFCESVFMKMRLKWKICTDMIRFALICSGAKPFFTFCSHSFFAGFMLVLSFLFF